MGRIKGLIILLVLGAGLVSCDMLNVDVDSNFSGNLNIEVPAESMKGTLGGIPFSSFVTLDPKDDPDVEKYADLIVDVGVNNIEATVTSLSVDEVTLLAGTEFVISDDEITATYILAEDWAISVGSELMLPDQDGFYGDVEDILMDAEEFTLGMEGSSSLGSVFITINVNIDV